MPYLSLAALIVLPLAAFHVALLVVYSFWLRRCGKFSCLRVTIFSTALAALLATSLALTNFGGYTELVSSGQILVLDGIVQLSGYIAAGFAGAVAALVGAVVGGGCYFLGVKLGTGAKNEA